MYQAGGGPIWVVSHKPVGVEAGLGHMGIHRTEAAAGPKDPSTCRGKSNWSKQSKPRRKSLFSPVQGLMNRHG